MQLSAGVTHRPQLKASEAAGAADPPQALWKTRVLSSDALGAHTRPERSAVKKQEISGKARCAGGTPWKAFDQGHFSSARISAGTC